jgi:hypothetical protein
MKTDDGRNERFGDECPLVVLGHSERDGMIMKPVVGVAGIAFILFLATSVVVQISGLSQGVAQQTATTLYDSGDPTPEEQLVLEYINRARADPSAEGVRLRNDANYLWKNLPGGGGNEIDVRPPLAMNKALLLSARFHNDDMYKNGFFGHQDTVYGSAWKRIKNGFGYPLVWGAENVASWPSPTTAQDELMTDGDCLDSNQCSHRINLFDPNYAEVGIGWLATAGYLTQDFAFQNPRSGNAGSFLVGVVYNDLNGNNFYDIGEGISGVTITPSTGTYYAVSSTSGGYAFPIATSGTIAVTASGSEFGAISKTVSLTGANIKLDFTIQDHSTLTTTTTSSSETQSTTSTSEAQPTTSTTSETQTSTSMSITQSSTSTTETQTRTSASATQTTTTSSKTQTTTSESRTLATTTTSTSTSEWQTTTSASEAQTTTDASETQTTTGASETEATTSTGKTSGTTSAAQTQTATIETPITSPANTTSITTTSETTTYVVPTLPLSPPRCVIVTATFGSPLAPEVVYMRYVRDQLIGSTPTGRTLVDAFNIFYYAWSPPVAGAIAGNGLLRAVFRIILLPLIGIVHVSAMVFRTTTIMTGQTDWASVFAFAGAAVMTISVYIALPIAAAAKSRQAIKGLYGRFDRSWH